MQEIKNILVFCPMSPTMPRLWGATVQSILRMTSETIGLEFWFRGHDNPYEEPYRNVAHNYNTARKVALQMGMDAMLSIEADMIVPPDTVERLVACESDIAYGLYVWRHGRKEWSAYTELSALKGKSISRDPERAKAAWGTVIDVAGVGQGCTLYRRNVLEAIPFTLFPGSPNVVSCDWMLAIDAQLRGFSQRCDLGCVCGHQTYEPWPQILWPDPEAPDLYRIESLPNPKTGKLPVKVIRQGETLEIPVGEMGGQVEVYKVAEGQMAQPAVELGSSSDEELHDREE
jgi:hypothetical protein